MKRLWVDFNEVYDDDHIWTSTRRMRVVVTPEPGETVELYDGDGETCWATVESVVGPIVHARIHWPSYRPAVGGIRVISAALPNVPEQAVQSDGVRDLVRAGAAD